MVVHVCVVARSWPACPTPAESCACALFASTAYRTHRAIVIAFAVPAAGYLLRGTTIAFEKEPAVSLEIFRSVPSSGRTVFDLRKYRCSRRFGALEMGIEVVYQDHHSIDDPGHRRPSPGALAALAMAFGTFVIRSR